MAFKLLIFVMIVFGVFEAALSLIMVLAYRKARKRWLKIAAIMLGSAAALSLLVSCGVLIWATSF